MAFAHDFDDAPAAAPAFDEARTLRQKSRAAGMDPDYWYAVALASEVAPGGAREVSFWNRSIVLFRTEGGEVAALDNRCPHRQLKLSLGQVEDCRLVCAYHGWSFGGDGRIADIPHDLFGRERPNLRVRSYPVKERYGLVWIFPGDRKRAEEVRIPDIPELEGPDRWACVPISLTWNAHFSMIIDNVSDFTHAHLHRKYRPFVGARLTHLESKDDRVTVEYDTQVGRGNISGLFVDRGRVDTNHMQLCFEYPYQWSDTDGQIKHWLFVLPEGPRRTRAFFLFYFKAFKIPLLPIAIPCFLMTPLLRIANRLAIRPLLEEDGMAVEAEQEGYDAHWDAPPAEVNPAVKAFQELTVHKWAEHLEEHNR